MLAAAAYKDYHHLLPKGYKPMTQAEFNKHFGNTRNLQIPGFRYNPVTGFFDGVSGFQGRLIVNEFTGKFTISFEGTSSFNILVRSADVVNGVIAFTGNVPRQFHYASQLVNAALVNSQGKFDVVGHSLGAANAVYAVGNNNAGNRIEVTTFNAYALHPDILKTLNFQNTQITNIRNLGDSVSGASSNHIGPVYEVTNNKYSAHGIFETLQNMIGDTR